MTTAARHGDLRWRFVCPSAPVSRGLPGAGAERPAAAARPVLRPGRSTAPRSRPWRAGGRSISWPAALRGLRPSLRIRTRRRVALRPAPAAAQLRAGPGGAALRRREPGSLTLAFKHGDHRRPRFRRRRLAGPRRLASCSRCRLVVPVPLRRRACSPVGTTRQPCWANVLGRSRALPVVPDLLHAPAQYAAQGRLERDRPASQAMAGAFAVARSRRAELRGRRTLLVDDVLTTGATVEACAALRRAGARRSTCWLWMRGPAGRGDGNTSCRVHRHRLASGGGKKGRLPSGR